MSDLDDKTAADEQAWKAARERETQLERALRKAEKDSAPPEFAPDHAKDGGVI